jgi:hypothetical protein
MRFDTKIAIVVRTDLAAWQKLNVTAFLASAVAAGVPGVIGEDYLDGAGHTYLPMYRQPVLIYAADGPGLGLARTRALERGLPAAIYIDEMFKTGNDQDNRAAVLVERRCLMLVPVVGWQIFLSLCRSGCLLWPRG